jgi:hypothetical protein
MAVRSIRIEAVRACIAEGVQIMPGHYVGTEIPRPNVSGANGKSSSLFTMQVADAVVTADMTTTVVKEIKVTDLVESGDLVVLN